MEDQLTQAFQLCTNNSTPLRLQGESMLKQMKQDIYYPLHLLSYIRGQQIGELQLRAALEFKSFTKDYTMLNDYELQPYSEVMNQIKQVLLQITMPLEHKIFLQMVQSIRQIASKEFPGRWHTLMKELCNLANHPEFRYRCFKIIKCVTARYEYESRSDPLYEEIILVCDDVHDQLLNLIGPIVNQLQQNSSGDSAIQVAKILNQGLKVFYFLNYHDIHPKFEDNLNTWMEILICSLKIQINDFLGFKIKGAALRQYFNLRNILLYSRKYREDVEGLIQTFSQEIWQVCTTIGPDEKYDKICINALKYFKDLLTWDKMMPFFAQNISNLMQSLILPNLQLNGILLIKKMIKIYLKRNQKTLLATFLNCLTLFLADISQFNCQKCCQDCILKRQYNICKLIYNHLFGIPIIAFKNIYRSLIFQLMEDNSLLDLLKE